MRRLASASLLAALLTASAGASAIEIENVAGEPLFIDVTNTSVFNYHFDNRNSDPKTGNRDDVVTLVDDNYGEWLDRLNIQANYWRLRLGLRFDASTYFGTPSRKDAKDLAYEELAGAPARDRNDYANQFFRDLNNRYLNTYYPAKLYVGYAQPGLDITLGDFYTQLGRGLVFSVRKVDELALDTTVRGAKIVFDRELGPVHVGLTAFAGQMNPLRIDETSGRRITSSGSPLFFGFPKGQELITYSFKDVGTVIKDVSPAAPEFFPETVIGGHIEAGPSAVMFGLNSSIVFRHGQDDPIKTFSGSVNVPSILNHGDVYVEVAGQQGGPPLSTSQEGKSQDARYAVYVNANARGGPLTVSLEGKHYRRFLPLTSSIATGVTSVWTPPPGLVSDRSASEFVTVAYNQPPTTESIYVEPIGSPNICITGGRARADVRLTRQTALYAWVGRYVSYSEKTATNFECDTAPENQTNTWDSALGSEIEFDNGRSHSKAWVGARVTSLEVPIKYLNIEVPGTTDEFYREGYIRYDLVKHLTGPFSLQMQGFHRRRFEPALNGNPWTEGENYTALQWSPHLSAIFGYEYLAKKGCVPGSDDSVCHYVSGGLQWKSGAHDKIVGQLFDTVSLFVGQRRGAIRCVSGVCRQFPPFEGAKLEIVSRF